MIEPKDQTADVTSVRLAAIYAEALLNAAEASNSVKEVMEELDSLLDDVVSKNPQLRGMFAGAAIGRNARRDAIERVFAKRACDTFYKFMLVLNDHDRLDMLRPIRFALHELHESRTRRLRVHVYSAVALSSEFQAQLLETLRQHFKLEPVLIYHVQPALLGGMKLRIGDRVMDATVRTRIDNLRNQLIERSSHEIQSRRDRFSSAE